MKLGRPNYLTQKSNTAAGEAVPRPRPIRKISFSPKTVDGKPVLSSGQTARPS